MIALLHDWLIQNRVNSKLKECGEYQQGSVNILSEFGLYSKWVLGALPVFTSQPFGLDRRGIVVTVRAAAKLVEHISL